VKPGLTDMLADLASRRGAGTVTFVRGEHIVRWQQSEYGSLVLELAGGEAVVIDGEAQKIIGSKVAPRPLIPEPGTIDAERAALLRLREADPPAAKTRSPR